MAKPAQDGDVMLDQIRAIDNQRLIRRLGTLPNELTELIRFNLKAVLDL